MPARSSTASPLDLVQIDQTQMDIVVVDEETRQSVARPRLTDRLRELSVRVGLDADAEPSSASTSTLERTTRDTAGDAHRSTRLSQGFCRYDSSRDGDRDRVRQVYAAQFVARRIQIRFDAGERQIQNPGNVVVCLASRGPDQTLLLSFRQFDGIRRQFEIDARGGVDQNSHWL
jgi:hypothetical protein